MFSELHLFEMLDKVTKKDIKSLSNFFLIKKL